VTSGGAAPVGRLRAAGKLLALLGLGGILATSWITATGVSARHDSGHAGALQGLAGPLTADGFRTALLVLGLCYLVVLACGIAGTLPRRPALVTVIVAQLLFALMAIAPGQDLYTYLGFARLESIHAINPYEHGLIAARDDPLFELAAFRRTTTPYGPLFTLITIAVTPLPVAVAAWTLKAILVSAMLGCLGMVWAIARELRPDMVIAPEARGFLLGPAIAREVGAGQEVDPTLEHTRRQVAVLRASRAVGGHVLADTAGVDVAGLALRRQIAAKLGGGDAPARGASEGDLPAYGAHLIEARAKAVE